MCDTTSLQMPLKCFKTEIVLRPSTLLIQGLLVWLSGVATFALRFVLCETPHPHSIPFEKSLWPSGMEAVFDPQDGSGLCVGCVFSLTWEVRVMHV